MIGSRLKARWSADVCAGGAMLIYILAGLYAIIVKNIALGRQLRISGRHAKLYGIVLLVGCIPISTITSVTTIFLLPEAITGISIVMRLIDALIAIAIAVGLIYPFALRQRREEAGAKAR